MQLKTLSIKNFRNYKDLSLDFNENINIFVGNNAEGKTNLLESIYVLAITKSHRMYIDNNLIKNGELFTKIKGTVKTKENEKDLEVLINSNGKSVKINNNIIKKVSDYISKFTVIIFCPDDLEIVKGSPSVRRKFLNIEIGQLSNKYLSILNDYNAILKNRNEYLRKSSLENIDKTYIGVINEQLINKAILIYKYRSEFLKDINEESKKIYENLAGKGSLSIKYEPNIEFDEFDEQLIKNKMNEKFKSNLKREVIQGMTLFGPHRDDFSFLIDNNEIKEYGSQGQHRLAVLCLKFGEIEIFRRTTEEYPILLLDDIFSELDKKKKNNIIKYIKKDIQTFITTTDVNKIKKDLLKESNIYNIRDGEIK